MSSKTATYPSVQASYLWKEGDLLSQWKSDPKFVSLSLKHRCLQYRHSDAPNEPAYKTFSLYFATGVRELPLAHSLVDYLTPAQGLSSPSRMLNSDDTHLPPFAFEITTPTRTQKFRAASADACKAWVEALQYMFSCYRRPFKVLHAGKLLLRTGGAMSFFRSFEIRSVLLTPRYLLVFESQSIGEEFVEKASADPVHFLDMALHTNGVLTVLIEGAICAEVGEIDEQPYSFVVSCARSDGNTSKVGDQFEFAARSEQHLQAWMEAMMAEMTQPAQQEKDYKKILKHAHKDKDGKKHKEKKHSSKSKSSDVAPASPAIKPSTPAAPSTPVAAPAVAPAEPVESAKSNAFREFDTAQLPTFTSANQASTSDTVSFSAAAQSLNVHLSTAEQRLKEREQKEADIQRRQQRRLQQMARDEMIKKRAEQERDELVEILSGTIAEWKQRHAHDIRLMINNLHEVFDVRQDQYSVPPDALLPAVRRIYNRLLLVIHPDRTVNDTIEKQICATVLFAEMRNAFELFEAWCAAQEDDDD